LGRHTAFTTRFASSPRIGPCRASGWRFSSAAAVRCAACVSAAPSTAGASTPDAVSPAVASDSARWTLRASHAACRRGDQRVTGFARRDGGRSCAFAPCIGGPHRKLPIARESGDGLAACERSKAQEPEAS
jgi:hypothetical protein